MGAGGCRPHPVMKPSAVIIFNPTARGEKAQALRPLLDAVSGKVALRPTRGPGDATVLAAEAVTEGFKTIVAAGGDGTVNEVLNGMALPKGGLEQSRLAVIPLGTVNVFAKELRVPEALPQALELALGGKELLIDLPRATFEKSGKIESRCFIQLAGAGLDSRAIAHVRWEEKKRWGQIAYGLAGFRALRERLPRVRVHLEKGVEDSGELVLLGNGRYYGGRWPLFPFAEMSDGRVDIAVLPRAGVLSLLRLVWSLSAGTFSTSTIARHYQASSFRLSADRACEFELEGDNVGMLPVTVSTQARALRVVVPLSR